MAATDPEIRRQQLDLNFQRLPSVLASFPPVSIGVSWALWDHVAHATLVTWVVLFCGLAAVGFGVHHAYRSRFPALSLEAWCRVRTAAAAANGLACGGFASTFLIVPHRFDLQAFVLLVITVTSVGALASSTTYFPAFATYNLANLLPVFVRSLLEATELYTSVGLLVVLFMVVMLTVGYQMNEGFTQQFELQRDNRALVEDLRRARDRLEESNQELNARVSERTAELEEALAQKLDSEVQLRRAQKMDAIGRLAGGVAHDFNNALTGIMGSAGLLERKLAPGSPEAEEVRAILAGADRAAQLTKQLLALAKGGLAEPESIDVNRRLEELMRLLRRVLGSSTQLLFVPSEDGCRVSIDPNQFDQLVMNLVVNAKDASPSGGQIVVRVVRSRREGGPFICISVSDRGSGISPEILEHIFEPFFTTKGERGTGLGLSTCFGIAQRAQGSIEVDTMPGVGSTFTVVLPMTEQASPATAAKGGSKAYGNWRERTVLLVEDQEPVLRTASRILTDQGATVIPARSAEEALEKIARTASAVDVVVTDVSLPLMSGVGLVQHLRKAGYTGPCLLMSGYIDERQLQLKGADERIPLLPKPFTSGELVAAVTELMEAPPDASDPTDPQGRAS